MKKILSAIILTVLIVSALCISAFATNDFVGENEFVIASFNGINTYVKDNDKFENFEVSAYWLADSKDAYNLKYVSFLGQIANNCQHTYATVITAQKQSAATLIQLSLDDPEWQKQYNKVASVVSEFKNVGLPIGFSIDREDYVSGGYSRDNLAASILGLETIMPEDANYDYLDDNNYCTYVSSNNGVKYMIFQLEMYPKTATLEWFKQTVEANPDKYAIVCTTSFIDGSGAMYTMWDWNDGFTFTGTTSLKSMNITWTDNPRDGEALWDYALKDCDRLLAIICGNAGNGEIVSTKLKGTNGNEVAVFGANADAGLNASGSPVLMTKISADNTEITCAWAEAMEGVDKPTAKTIKLGKIGALSEALVDTTLPKIPAQSNGSNTAYIFGYEGNTFRPNANMTRAEACTIFARLILGVQNIPDGYVTRFTDVKEDDWFHNAVAFLDQTGYFFRNKNTEYKPNEPITRAEFVDLANSASKLTGVSSVSFTDVPNDHFYYMSINAAAASGLVNGYEDGTFRPDNTITRAEVVTVINRLLGLRATEKSISMDHLDNVFVDIGSHWAKLNILMASNSNVHTDNYYKASLEGVEEKPTEFVFANKHFSFSVNKKNGKVTEFINLATGEDILASSTAPQFIYLSAASGAKLVPTLMEAEGGTIKITFKNGYVVYLLVEIRDNYMTFEIDSDLPASISSVTFANLSTNLQKAVDDDDYLLNAIGMTYWTNPVNKGFRLNAASVTAQAHTIYEEGTAGAKLGVVFASKADSIKYLQEVTDAIDPSVGLTSKAGGAYAKEWEGNYGDYALVTSLNPEQIEENIKLAVDLDIDQYDVHQGGSTFRQGDFVFAYTDTGTAKEYYEKIGSKIAEAGLKTGLHTYAYYIAYSAENILKEPKWQEDLEKLDDVYTLRKKMTKFSRNAATEEDASDFDMTYTFFYKNSLYIMIDNEIMKVGQGTSSGFINVERGQCGTDATPHAAGAKIYHLSGYFQMFVPKFGSDLFYHIADLTAQAYNDGGFDMIYLDAIDGIGRHLPEGHQQWYWFHKFVHRIVSQCDRYPILETSSSAPQEWNVRGRTGAWDTANRSIKKMINEHMTVNKGTMENNMNTTLGWFSFFPDQSPTAGMKNTIQKSIFHDDFDALGMGALLYDMSIVFNPFNAKSITENPFHYENIKYYTETYTKLRKSHYFNEDVINKVKEIGGEWRVIEKKQGEYVFQQMYYNYANLTYATDYTIDRVKGNNPFDAQMPFIRIESRYSTLFENPITMYDFGSNAISTSGGAVIIEKKLSAPINMTTNMAMTLRVKGTGKDGDALLLSMVGGTVSGESGGRADYFVDLNFEGWRDVVLLDLDSADYDFNKYSFSGIGVKGMQYATYRTNANYNSIMNLYIRLSGSTAYTAQVGELKAYAQTEAPIKNPTITVGSSKVTFNCEMKGGEYLEYDPETNKAILYHNAEQTKEEITFTGTLNVGKGNFEAVYTAEKQTDAPLRARVTLGFLGQEIGNN